METNEKKSPIEFSAARRSLPFGTYECPEDEVQWSICQGMVTVTKGKSKYVVPKLLFGVVEDENGEYSIAVFWHHYRGEEWLDRAYSLSSMRRFAFWNQIEEVERGLTFKDMVKRIRKVYPKLQMPSIDQFYAQYGLTAEQVEGAGKD